VPIYIHKSVIKIIIDLNKMVSVTTTVLSVAIYVANINFKHLVTIFLTQLF